MAELGASIGEWLKLIAAFARFQTLFLVYLHMVFFLLCWGIDRFDAPAVIELAAAVVAMTLCYVNATAVNDLSDQAADRINLAGEPDRPLASGQASPRQVWVVALTAGAISLGAAAVVSPWATLAAAAMLGLNAIYSLPPVRIAGRGALAQVLLPLEYCAFPAVLTASAVGFQSDGLVSLPEGTLRHRVVVYGLMVAAMYLIFVGRVFLKDIRDEVGDRATGKLTFTVRHGRRTAIVWSAVTTVAGTVALSVVMFVCYEASPGFVFGFCGLSLTGQVVALVQTNQAPSIAEAVLYTGIYGRWISMKVFFYVMLMLLAGQGLSFAAEALILGGTVLAIVFNVAMLYQQVANHRVRTSLVGPTPG
ncbi:MAG: UbiA family prenyltransferase [Bifidobacteriaceae bacterium]|nr:UbiA family prenyltransferase [Bifidobacteriaceae bacterium]